VSASVIEDGITPLAHGKASSQVHGRHAARPQPTADGEGEADEPSGPVNWHGMLDDEYAMTFDALTDFLAWAVPHWGFTTEQFPYGCWWLHGDIVEEMTSWWTMWQAYVRNPAAHPADPSVFHERTWNLKQRLGYTYQGRCRHEHQTVTRPVVAAPSACRIAGDD
jgi:hypothetical protein